MRTVAVTGGIACGKSLVGQILQAEGIPVCDTDEVAHRLMRRGQPVFEQVLAHFGVRVLDSGGEIDRRVLGEIVFRDESERMKLNALVHPEVDRELRRWMEGRRGESRPAAAGIIPLLFEAGLDSGWDVIVCVSASEAVQLRRLLDRNLTIEEARRRIASQWPVEQKAARADFVLVNNGSKELLRMQTERLLSRILEKR